MTTADSLFKQLKHPNPNLRERAMVELAENRDENTIPRLMGILEDEDMVYRRTAVKALGVIGLDAVPTLVDSVLNSENSTIRASCTKALAQVAVNYHDLSFPEEGIQGLKIALNDPDPVVHISAVMALGAIGSPVLDILIEALKTTENLAVGVAIINALGSIGDAGALQALTELAEDESADQYIRESATSALSRLDQVISFKSSKEKPQ